MDLEQLDLEFQLGTSKSIKIFSVYQVQRCSGTDLKGLVVTARMTWKTTS